MRDISELPGGTEQAKPTNQRPRGAARPRTENQASGSQEQETRPTSRRRPTSAAPSHNNDEQRPPRSNTGGHRGQSQQGHQEHESGQQRTGNGPQGRTNPQRGSAPQRSGGGSTYRGDRPGGPGRSGGGPRPATTQRVNTDGPVHSEGPSRGDNASRGSRPNSRPGGGQGRQSGPGQNRSGGGQGRQSGPGQNRSGGGQGRPSHGRPAQRSNNGAARSQERRTAPVKEKVTGPIQLPPQIIVKDLAEQLDVSPIEVIRDLISKHAIFASINQVIDYEKAALVATDLGFEPSPIAATDGPVRSDRPMSASEAAVAARKDNNNIEIPPVVTIMGHVDHGKTSLLDVIRKTKVAAGEAGGITQHIGAYQVEVNGKKITFLDTPGHEAFTAMRARGAQVAQIAIIVIAADDGVMPQTREAIEHAQAAKMPIIIALNKIDRPNANPDRVKQQLADIGILIEEYGGETVLVPVSAKKGEGIDELLDYILLVAEVQDIRANPDRRATGVIIEAKMERNSGVAATVLVQQGTLKMGDNIVVGSIAGKIRAMFNDRGKRIQKASPSTPVSIMGLSEVPQAGDQLEVTEDEKTAKVRAQQEADKRRDEAAPLGRVNLDTLYMQMQEGTVKELELVLKSDVQGSSEAIKGALSKLSEENLKVRLIREGIGNISETDIHLAAASGAIIIGFNVKADGAAEREAQREGVDIRYYNVIYKLIEDIQAALHGMLEPTYREVVDGHAEVMQIFKAGKSLIAGCRITDGRIARSSQARILRGGEKPFEGKVASLRRGKDDVREVLTGYECGIVLEDYNEYEVGDIIEAFSQERVAPGA